jgi:hypothetical protein
MLFDPQAKCISRAERIVNVQRETEKKNPVKSSAEKKRDSKGLKTTKACLEFFVVNNNDDSVNMV